MTYMLPILLASIWQHDRDWVLPYDICCANETFPQPSATHLKSLFRYAKLVNIGHMNEENPNAFHTSTTNSKIKLLRPEEQQSEARLGRGSQYLSFCNVRICLLSAILTFTKTFPLEWITPARSFQLQCAVTRSQTQTNSPWLTASFYNNHDHLPETIPSP